ncbi:MAG: virulence protein RhuM/Fic/DOC family protein, partial [Patescibacteria group bacterium]|nr:virulence protein RhuM/Fic/DOC family protein [Patescibacteria group bacterium]
IDRTVVTKHINKILKDGEVNEKSNVQKMHIANSDKLVKFYSLDILLVVGYRTNSAKAIEFRKWATKVLRQHLLYGYTINKKRIAQNYEQFLHAVADVKALLPKGDEVRAKDVLELINAFAGTWFSLDAYDKDIFPKGVITKKKIMFTSDELLSALQELKQNLISKKQATNIFGQERSKSAVQGIVGNVFQTIFKKDVYPTVEEKIAHLLYFMVKNHPFVDGNKRSGAFAFVWFLRKAGLLRASMTPEALTAFTLLIAESNPKDKDKMVGLVLLLLKKK